MTLDEIKEIIREKVGTGNLYNLVRGYEYDNGDEDDSLEVAGTKFEEAFGQKFTSVRERRSPYGDHDSYEWVWKIGDRFFACYGYYCSHNGTELSDVMDFIEVTPVEQTVVEYVRQSDKTLDKRMK